MGLLQLPYGPIVYAANSTPASDHAANFLSPQEPNRQPGAFMGSEKFVELTNLDEITKQLETWRDSHSMLFVLDGNLQMLVWSEGMIRVGSVWSCSQKIGAELSFSPRITHDQQLLSAYRFSCYPIHVCTHDPHDVLHRQVVLALEKRYFSC